MNKVDHAPVIPTPSIPQLIKTTMVAAIVAGVLLVTAVLPAEYAIDPIGTGRLLGLTDIAIPPVPVVDEMRSEGAALLPTMRGPLGEYPAGFKIDSLELTLQPYEYVEYKYRLESGAAFLYSWTSSSPLVHDFHGERDSAAPDGTPAEESFDKSTRREANGVLTAPFTGIHGWYWENPGGTPVTIRLNSAGFYTSAVEIRSDRTRHPRTLHAPGETTGAPTGANTLIKGETQ